MTTTEKYFKALGWVYQPITTQPFTGRIEQSRDPSKIDKPYQRESMGWVKGSHALEKLPNITQSYPDFKKWVLEKMEGERDNRFEGGLKLVVYFNQVAWMFSPLSFIHKEDIPNLWTNVENGETLEAAVEAACRYWEGK